MKEINFDMDGTLADFYNVDGWLDCIMNESTLPYEIAKPLIRMSDLARVLNRLQSNGYKINIISWTSKNGSKEYCERTVKAKIKWLENHLPSVHFNQINIVAYGTPKNTIGNGILFDDEIGNRTTWGKGAYDEKNILEILKNL